ncbi:uncharacterized protein K444DRAFT_611195, partial [Hyaloscypha bicolor E]
MLAALQATGSCCSLAPMARANLTLLQCYLGIPGVVGIGVPLIGTPQNYSGQGPA